VLVLVAKDNLGSVAVVEARHHEGGKPGKSSEKSEQDAGDTALVDGSGVFYTHIAESQITCF
jgi:hypothetical protein